MHEINERKLTPTRFIYRATLASIIVHGKPLHNAPFDCTKTRAASMATMNRPCFAAIRELSPTKPTLIFVASRRQTRLTA